MLRPVCLVPKLSNASATALDEEGEEEEEEEEGGVFLEEEEGGVFLEEEGARGACEYLSFFDELEAEAIAIDFEEGPTTGDGPTRTTAAAVHGRLATRKSEGHKAVRVMAVSVCI